LSQEVKFSPSSFRKKIWVLLEPAKENDVLSKFVDIFLLVLIFLNVLMVILETVDDLFLHYNKLFRIFEYFSVLIFSLEYVGRIWSCVEYKHCTNNFRVRIKYLFSFPSLIDLIAIAPSLLAFIFPSVDLRFVRVLRIFRFLKFSRYSSSINNLLTVIWNQRKSFGAAFFILFIMLIIASSGMYLVEKDAQPEKFGSIPQAMWWSIVTLTTVGYGDVYPITTLGKFFGSAIIILGIGTVALPSGILASAFSEHTRKSQNKYKQELENALRDNRIDKSERNQLNKLAESLNLSDEDIHIIESLYKSDKN
jgi:voltage-gated potassium channel